MCRGTAQDVEKAAAKVGVVLQSVKEVLLGMVADDLVHEDRIGASKYYWAFPSEAATKVRATGSDSTSGALLRRRLTYRGLGVCAVSRY